MAHEHAARDCTTGLLAVKCVSQCLWVVISQLRIDWRNLGSLPDGVVLDMFAGSGTTGVAALKHGWRFVGCESVGQYFAVEQCSEVVPIA